MHLVRTALISASALALVSFYYTLKGYYHCDSLYSSHHQLLPLSRRGYAAATSLPSRKNTTLCVRCSNKMCPELSMWHHLWNINTTLRSLRNPVIHHPLRVTYLQMVNRVSLCHHPGHPDCCSSDLHKINKCRHIETTHNYYFLIFTNMSQ